MAKTQLHMEDMSCKSHGTNIIIYHFLYKINIKLKILQLCSHCRSVEDPKTPDKFQVCSTRSWTGQVRCWRIKLHEWDPPNPMHGHGSSIFDLVSQRLARLKKARKIATVVLLLNEKFSF